MTNKIKSRQLKGQRKAFSSQKISEPSCVRKETVDIDILVTSRNSGRKNHAVYRNNE